jgi:hypothetical protein
MHMPRISWCNISVGVFRIVLIFFYRLCHESVANFDPTLNNSHLQECLKRLLHFYDGCNNYLYTDINPTCNDYIVETRPEFEALYLIFNLGNDEALRRVLGIPDKCKLDNARFLFDVFFIHYVRLQD